MNPTNYTRTEPNLINTNIVEKLEGFLDNVEHFEFNWGEGFYYFFNTYIWPNIFPIIVFLFIGAFLLVRYLLKQHKVKKKKKKVKEKSVTDIDQELENINFDDPTEILDPVEEVDNVEPDMYRYASHLYPENIPNANADIGNYDNSRAEFNELAKLIVG